MAGKQRSKRTPASRSPSSDQRRAKSESFDQLDRVIHEKARLEIMTTLVAHPFGLLFNDLKSLCDLTDGNLNRHLKVLIEAELVHPWKSSGAKKPQTMYRITELGRTTFVDYLKALESIVETAQSSIDSLDPKVLKIRTA